ncbi:SigE family RNA polymerase sigma factor [Streptomyces phaeochromogenes]
MDLATEWKLSAGRGEAGAEVGLAEMDFQQFVAARSAPLFRGALVLTGNRETAEDLVQETLERVCRKWRTIVAKDAPDAYVRRIMVNLANDRWRRFRRTVPHQDTGDMAAPGDEYGRIDSRDQLVRALQSLPMRMRMRTVVVLRYFHDLSDAEIAADLRISQSTVRSQLARGMEKLRSQFPALSNPSPRQPEEGTR